MGVNYCNLKRRILSVILDLSVALYLSVGEILMCQLLAGLGSL